jgi:hypothetical protein
MINKETWKFFEERLNNPRVFEALQGLYEIISRLLANRIDDIAAFEDKAIMMFSEEREIIRINTMRNSLRIYIHPAAKAFFDPDEKYKVERINLWESSLQKKTGKYRGLSVWLSNKKYLRGIEKIIKNIPD